MPAKSLRVLTLAGLFALAGCADTDTPEATPSLTVALAAPQTRDVVREVVASGAVAAWEEVSVGVELSGVRVASVEVEVGSVVEAGDVLLRLDDRTLASQLLQADASATEAATNLETARRQAARVRELADEQMVSVQDAEEAEAARDNAQARLNTAIASRDAARVQRGFTVVRAPVAGVVSARSVQPGQVVGAGGELLRLIRDGRLEWRAELAEADLLLVAPGALVQVDTPAGPVAGQVRRVSPSLDAQSRTATIYVDLPAPGPLRAGMFAQGRITLGRADALLIPLDAVVRRDGRAYVFTVEDDHRVRERGVAVGATHGGQIELPDGLTTDDRVVARGAGFLGDGDLVRVVDAQAADAPPPQAQPADADADAATGTDAR
ncbi:MULTISPECIES: efflux RND transporter periplasmic adaptor subunit [Luteimonas]|uniref:efflux RND transporter periplasmic adaptor subunit n=1 Tax=Luteimonas TaxID=83614 RepID=UPI000C7AC72E|nr:MULTISPECIES: efflux RND transporter periplasmic adaptor subunit [Luteimonas]